MDGVGHNHGVKHRLEGLRHQRLQWMAFDRETQFCHIRQNAGMARNHNGDFLGAYIPSTCLYSTNRSVLTANTRDLTVLDDIDAAGICRSGKTPGDGVMSRHPAPRLEGRAQHRISRLTRHIHRWNFCLYLSGCQDLAVDSVQAVGV